MTTPYRDDFDAAQEKLASLEQELASVKSRAEELSKLGRSEASLAREVAALKARLDGMAKKRALPLLESVRIASPCKADWNEMVGDERVRFCGSCEKNVYNLSDMARDEAERFVRENSGGACVRLYRRTDGTVLTSDCPVGRKRKRMRNVALAVVSSGMLAAGALFSWRSTRPPVAMGDMMMMGKPTAAPTDTGGWIGGAVTAPDTAVPPTRMGTMGHMSTPITTSDVSPPPRPRGRPVQTRGR